MKTEQFSMDRNCLWVKWIDYLLILILSVACLKYILHQGKFFAESLIKFSFLDFPIFIGEFLLGICMLLFGVRWILAQNKIKKWYWIVIVFYGFVVLKAIIGYIEFGPLALRDAALFYYSLFAFIGYVCFQQKIFRNWISLFFYLGLFWHGLETPYNEFWLVPRIFLGLALAYSFPDRRLGFLMALGVLIFTPYQYFLNSSRSFFLGGFVSISFFLAVVPFIFKASLRKWLMIGNVVLIIFFGAYVFHFSGSRPAQGLLAFDKLKTFWIEMKQEIERKRKTFKPQVLEKVKVFSPSQFPVAEGFQNTSDVSKIEKVKDLTVNASNSIRSESIQRNEINNRNDVANVKNDNTSNIKGQENQNPSFVVKEMKLGNSVFRLLLWQNAVEEIAREKKLLGINFGKPFRSENLEMVRSAVGEWQRVGWIAMHNSYLHIVFRSGLIGVLLILVMFYIYGYMIWTFIVHKSLPGLLVGSSLLVPFVVAFFAVTFEVPYFAIPIWTLYGMTLRLANDKWNKEKKV